MTFPVIGTASVRHSTIIHFIQPPYFAGRKEHFMNIDLLPHQQIEDYYNKIIDKSRRIHKTTQDIFLKFIEGLPPKSAFFCTSWESRRYSGSADNIKIRRGYRASHCLPTPPQDDQSMDSTGANKLRLPQKVLSSFKLFLA